MNLHNIYKVNNRITSSIVSSSCIPLIQGFKGLNNKNNIDFDAVKSPYRWVYLKAFKVVKILKNILTSQKSHD